MPKPRTKRGHAREERKRKNLHEDEESGRQKRQRQEDHNQNDINPEVGEHLEDGEHEFPDKEFFGMLADEEQEYFRRADEMLELNQFPSRDDRDVFLHTVFREAQGKELKLASSQSCSRLMERLIQLSDTRQKKRLFEAFAGHFLSLVQHRFASHCCEALFLRSAGVVTHELAGFVVDTQGTKSSDGDTQEPEASMESLFLATLDELEGGLGYLMTDRFASHTLRVLLLVLSGRPLEAASARSLMKSRKKEHVSVAGSAAADEPNQGARAVPTSFILAARKIVRDATAGMDATGLRVLARHPMGNPTLQLLLELDLTLKKGDKKKKHEEEEEEEEEGPQLINRLLPGAPQSLADESSEACEFVNGMIYDPLGSRLMETLIAHAPGKLFKLLNTKTLLPRIQGYVRNDIACYPAMTLLQRLSKEDLVRAVEQIAPTVPQLVARARFNVLRTLFERCAARGATEEIKRLMSGLKEGCGEADGLMTTLCCLKDDDNNDNDNKNNNKNKNNNDDKNEYAVRSHGAQLLTTLLTLPGPRKAVHQGLAALSSNLLIKLATASKPAAALVANALATPSPNSTFQKATVDALMPRLRELATSQFGHVVVTAMAEIPARGKDCSLPPHKKDAVVAALAGCERELRESWMGRSVWKSWRGDLWKTRRADWKSWMRNMEPRE